MHRYTAEEATVWTWRDYDRIAIKWRSQAHWDDIRVSLKDHFPRHCDLSYSGTRKLWSVPAWHRDRLEEWLCWTFEPEAVRWGEEPASGGAYGRTYSSSRRYAGGRRAHTSSTASTIEAAFRELYLLPTAPAWAAEAVYKAAVRAHHPDAGGDTGTMARINLAMETIRAHARQKAC